jgi:hypothetical protein
MDTDTLPKNTVMLAGEPILLIAPASLTVCREVLMASAHNYHRACVAALALCWQAPTKKRKGAKVLRPSITYSACDYAPLRLGGEFGDALEAAGVPYEDYMAAGFRAFLLVADQIPDDGDEARAEGN